MFLPKPGLVVGNRYSLTQAIGRGGMGEVWKAHDLELDTACAVKFILQHLATDRGIRERFAREAKAVARLRSPHVVQILGVGEVQDVPYLAMELLAGETLMARLERLGKLDPIVTMKVVEQAGEALESAHHSGIVHRDLKPENIWFWSGSKVFIKVLDFGVAKTGLKTGSLQTATGALVGTPQYMSPEQALGNRDVDHRSDLWSLAVIAIECLCGKRPFESEGLGDLLLKIVSNTPPSLQELAPELPLGLHDWWVRALARDPRERFQSATELVEALRPHLIGAAPHSELVYSGMAYSGMAHSGLPHSGLPHSGLPHSGLPHSGLPHSGLPHSGLPHSAHAAVPHSGLPHSAHAAVPHSGLPHSGLPHSAHAAVPHSALPHSALPPSGLGHAASAHAGSAHSGRQPAARLELAEEEAEPHARGAVTDAGGVVGAASGTVSRPMFPTEAQPRSAERAAGQLHAEPARFGSQPPAHAVPLHAGGPGAHPGTDAGVVSGREQRRVGGSVGPISSSRRAAPRDGRQRNVLIAAALLSVAVAGTAWRMLASDAPAAISSLPPPADLPAVPSGPEKAEAAVPAAPPAVAKPAGVADLPGGSPWDSALGNPKPGEPRTVVGALQPQARTPVAGSSPAAAVTSAARASSPGTAGASAPAEKPAVAPRATPQRATPAPVPPRAAAAAVAKAPAPVPPRKPPSISAADVGLSAPPPSPVNPGQSAAKPGAGGPVSDPSRGDGQAESEAERKAKLKRRIGLGSK